METMKESGKLRSDQLVDLTASLNFLSSSSSPQALPVKISRSSTPQCSDEQQQLSELKPLSLPSNDIPCTSCVNSFRYTILNYRRYSRDVHSARLSRDPITFGYLGTKLSDSRIPT